MPISIFAVIYNAILGVTKGDIIVGTTSGATTKLAVGSNNQVLTADSAQTNGVKWATPSGGSASGQQILQGAW